MSLRRTAARAVGTGRPATPAYITCQNAHPAMLRLAEAGEHVTPVPLAARGL
jgi:hypothetical protein